MDFDASTWGTVGQWASALITGSAFFATFYVIRRDAKVRRYAQARKVAYYQQKVIGSKYDDPNPRDYRYTVKNLSDEPIYGVSFYEHGDKAKSEGMVYEAVLLPGGEVSQRDTNYERFSGPRVAFRDNAGWLWNRDVNGHLHEGGGQFNMGNKRRATKPYP